MGHFFDRDGFSIADELKLEFTPLTFCGMTKDDDDDDDDSNSNSKRKGYPIESNEKNKDGVCRLGKVFAFGKTTEVIQMNQMKKIELFDFMSPVSPT